MNFLPFIILVALITGGFSISLEGPEFLNPIGIGIASTNLTKDDNGNEGNPQGPHLSCSTIHNDCAIICGQSSSDADCNRPACWCLFEFCKKAVPCYLPDDNCFNYCRGQGFDTADFCDAPDDFRYCTCGLCASG